MNFLQSDFLELQKLKTQFLRSGIRLQNDYGYTPEQLTQMLTEIYANE